MRTEDHNPALVDELYDIREIKRVLQDREDELVQLFRELGDGSYSGKVADVSVSTSNRRTIDLDELRRLYPDIAHELTVCNRVTTVRAIRKKALEVD